MFIHSYIPPDGEAGIRDYKYVGSDKSLIYNYIISPLSQWLVDHIVPPWLAPNVITLVGLLICVPPHLVLWYMFPNDFSGDVPSWVCYWIGTMKLIYLVLDNIDGKQARKTKNSSALGLLFDHGCDAVQVIITGIDIFVVMQYRNSFVAIYLFAFGCTPFYMATWEEYYVDAMNLGYINGATEGIIISSLLFLAGGYKGSQFWLKESFVPGVLNNELAAYMTIILSILTILGNIWTVLSTKPALFKKSLVNLVTFSYLLLSMTLVAYLSPELIEKRARYLIYLVGFSFAKLVGILQTSHVARIEFKPERKTIWISFTLLNLNSIYGAVTGVPLVDQVVLLEFLLGVTVSVYIHFVINIVTQLAGILKIKVFFVKPVAIEDVKAK